MLTATLIATLVMLSSRFVSLVLQLESVWKSCRDWSSIVGYKGCLGFCFFFFPLYDWLRSEPWSSMYQRCAASLPGCGIDWLIPVTGCAERSHQQSPSELWRNLWFNSFEAWCRKNLKAEEMQSLHPDYSCLQDEGWQSRSEVENLFVRLIHRNFLHLPHSLTSSVLFYLFFKYIRSEMLLLLQPS